jgi:hypothetical protein
VALACFFEGFAVSVPVARVIARSEASGPKRPAFLARAR